MAKVVSVLTRLSYKDIEEMLSNWAAVDVNDDGEVTALGEFDVLETVDDIVDNLTDMTQGFINWYTYTYNIITSKNYWGEKVYSVCPATGNITIIKPPAQGPSMYENNMLNLDKAKQFALQDNQAEFNKAVLELSREDLIELNKWFITHTKGANNV